MPVSKGFQAYVEEQLGALPALASKRMFGGVGLYSDGAFFALIANDVLYFKVDDTTQGDFEAVGSEPFRPFGDGRAMRYWAVPADVLEDRDALAAWAAKALAVARTRTR